MKEIFINLICNRITQLLAEQHITAETLAYQSGISKGGLSEILNGKKCPTSFTIAKICSGFNITLKEFYNFNDFDRFTDSL